jgi:hypothetical protein
MYVYMCKYICINVSIYIYIYIYLEAHAGLLIFVTELEELLGLVLALLLHRVQPATHSQKSVR